ncbi:hypothetical protein LNP74_01230 [Klebsiella pneumoniae subsp. pneumoniae]|nr:hypothetical protein [Klebsiella pneumoniae subsp. pneumoniae]
MTLSALPAATFPKFAKNFLAEAGDIRAAVRQYIAEVESGVYPGEEHSFH